MGTVLDLAWYGFAAVAFGSSIWFLFLLEKRPEPLVTIPMRGRRSMWVVMLATGLVSLVVGIVLVASALPTDGLIVLAFSIVFLVSARLMYLGMAVTADGDNLHIQMHSLPWNTVLTLEFRPGLALRIETSEKLPRILRNSDQPSVCELGSLLYVLEESSIAELRRVWREDQAGRSEGNTSRV
ncbi:MAG: hypothetical protein ACR2GQ_11460 [Gemmatimonadota bacterium]